MDFMVFGNGYLVNSEVYMNKISFSLTSIGYKILSIFLSIALGGLVITLCIFNNQIPWYAIVFAFIAFLFCIFATFLCFNHRIIINNKNKSLKIHVFRTKTIELENIANIKVDTSNSINYKKYCFIVIALNNGEIYKTSEYSTLIKNNAVKITEEKIKLLNQKIKKFS